MLRLVTRILTPKGVGTFCVLRITEHGGQSDHYAEPISLKEVSALAALNPEYFCRAFKRNFAKSFSEYLNMYRVAVARMLLDSGDNSVTEVSQKCGFNTPSYFAKVFKNYVGVLPSEYK